MRGTDNQLKIITIALIAVSFVTFDLYVYCNITRRLINPFSETMQAKSIELEHFLPFDENSRIVKVVAPEDYRFADDETLPVLDGATALFPVYSALFNAMYPEGSCDFVNGDFTEASLLQKRNTAGAFKAIVESKADIVFCAEPSQKQLEYAHENGVELTMVPIGYEAFVFLVNQANPVLSLTVDEVKKIFSGQISNWSKVQGDNSKIAPIIRAEGSGSQTAMINFMQGEKLLDKSNMFGGRSIGYSFRYYVQDIVSNSNIKMLALNGVAPTKENIQNKTYPVVANFYAIYRTSDARRKDIQKVINFVLSPLGQNIIEETGYVGL